MPPSRGTTATHPAAPRPAGRLRWLMVTLAFLAITINYIDRANLSVALPYMKQDLHLTTEQSGWILGAFFWIYSLFQLPIGRLVDRFGARSIFALAVAWWSLFTALTPLMRGFAGLFGVRLALGIGEAGAFPAATRTVQEWFPDHERGTASGIYDSGVRGGTLLSIPLVTALIAWVGWK